MATLPGSRKQDVPHESRGGESRRPTRMVSLALGTTTTRLDDAVDVGEEAGDELGDRGGDLDEAAEVDEGEEDGEVADGAGGEGEDEEAEGGDREAGAEVEGLVLPAVVEEVELDFEEERQDGLHHARDDARVVEVLDGDAALVGGDDLEGRVEAADDDVRREAREALDGGGAHEAAVAVRRERRGDFGAVRRRVELLRHDEGVLDGLAAALAEVGHHGVHGVAEERDGAVVPRAERRGRPVVEVALLDLVVARRGEDVQDVGRPAVEDALEVRARAVGLGLRLGRVGRPREEGVPLVARVADVGDDEVLVRPDEHLVADLAVVGGFVRELAREDRVSRIRDARALALGGFVAHRRADLRPDPVGADEHVGADARPVRELDDDGALAGVGLGIDGALLRVRRHGATVFDDALGQMVEQNRLQVGPLDDPRKGHLARRRRRREVEPRVPLVAHAVLDAVRQVARPRELALDLAVHAGVHRAEDLHRVRGELDRPAEPPELRRLLEDLDLDVRTLRREHVGQRESADAGARDDDAYGRSAVTSSGHASSSVSPPRILLVGGSAMA
eukprot:CAMPEP_0185700268 /NCGR_PEP_ID=MMETSP1164-20130828/7399_1 /TAXON_ID=1104430 /ORGANISM="Chrysoreinhardia sp, Strain CCMP2950" /LENGTH=562 /DNA_ID=CAMNT_0028367215 /DNA_START=101 /DNA_END=1787 /DNA_ORIENTATION=-